MVLEDVLREEDNIDRMTVWNPCRSEGATLLGYFPTRERVLRHYHEKVQCVELDAQI